MLMRRWKRLGDRNWTDFMDKTYAETQGEAPIDWNKFLANPPEKDSYDHMVAADLSGEWVTCACGNQCAIIPRHEYKGSPMDAELAKLGLDFCDDICEARWPVARATLAAIEARSAVLIREELAQLNATAIPSLPMLVPFVAR